MGNSKQANKKIQAAQKAKKKMFTIIGVVTILVLSFIIIRLNSSGINTTGAASGDLVMLKSEISETVKFYPYKIGKTNMEVLTVKASDGTIRTAFNTCQVCYSSGQGYYKQQGSELICQNCGNRFKLDQVEKIKGGCNPVPITKENKTDDGTNITISQAFMEENKGLFGNWRKK